MGGAFVLLIATHVRSTYNLKGYAASPTKKYGIGEAMPFTLQEEITIIGRLNSPVDTLLSCSQTRYA